MVESFPPAARPTHGLSRAAAAACLAILLTFVSGRSIHAQQSAPDVIRGKVTDDSSRALVAKVMITRGPDRLTQEATKERENAQWSFGRPVLFADKPKEPNR